MKKKAAVISVIIFLLLLASCEILEINNDSTNSESFAEEKSINQLTPNSIIVTFDPTGGVVSPTTKTVKHGPKYGELPVPTWSAHEFKGWWTEIGGKGIEITANSKVKVKEDHTLYAKWEVLVPDIIKGTAAIGATSISFLFSLNDSVASTLSLQPIEPNGYVKDESRTYMITSLSYDSSTGEVEGLTEEKEGELYSFRGVYSASAGFVGEITQSMNGTENQGVIAGIATYTDANVENYYGACAFNGGYDPRQPVTTWNVTMDFDNNTFMGTWCERTQTGYCACGTADGIISGNNISGSSYALPEFVEYMGHMNLTYNATLTDDRTSLSGTWQNYSDYGFSDGTLWGSKVSD